MFGEKVVFLLKDIKEYVDIVNVFCRLEFLMDVVKEFVEIDVDVFWV